MPRAANQKLKLLYLMDYLLQYTDEEHPAAMSELIAHLASRGVSAERKSIYDDLEALRLYGLDIEQAGAGRNAGYYAASRRFEAAELKLLTDSIQSSRFITEKKSAALIKKLGTLTNVYEAKLLQRQVFVSRRVKSMNESIYYNVDKLHSAISRDRQIRFKYFEYTVRKERRFRRSGAFYTVSPYALTWDSENYYLIAYESASASIRHYRVDKMAEISLCNAKRDGADAYAALDVASYTRKTFGMFAGEEKELTLRFHASLAGAVIDRLGRELILTPDGEEHFTVRTGIAVSPQFFGWLCGFGDKAELLAPDEVREEMRQHLAEMQKLYENV